MVFFHPDSMLTMRVLLGSRVPSEHWSFYVGGWTVAGRASCPTRFGGVARRSKDRPLYAAQRRRFCETLFELVDSVGRVVQATRTTEQGNNRFKTVDRGNYCVRVRKDGFDELAAPVVAAPAAVPAKASMSYSQAAALPSSDEVRRSFHPRGCAAASFMW